MANITSQKKRNRQTVVRHERNKAVRSELKTRIRNVEEAVESGDVEVAKEALLLAQKRIDSAAAKGVIHAKTAARRKSRLSRLVRAIAG